MALDFNEKRLYTKQATASIKALTGGNLPFNEKRTATKKLAEAVAKLSGKDQQEPKAPATLYERIMKGEFNDMPVEPFVKKVEEALEEVDGDGLPEAKACLKQYVQAHYDVANNLLIAA